MRTFSGENEGEYGAPAAFAAAARSDHRRLAGHVNESLRDLELRLREAHAPFLDELRQILAERTGQKLSDADELQEFKERLTGLVELLGVRPVLPTGERGVLQIRRRPSGSAWIALIATGRYRHLSAPANTIPAIELD